MGLVPKQNVSVSFWILKWLADDELLIENSNKKYNFLQTNEFIRKIGIIYMGSVLLHGNRFADITDSTMKKVGQTISSYRFSSSELKIMIAVASTIIRICSQSMFLSGF